MMDGTMPPAPQPPALLTTEEVAKLLRVHPKHVYRLLKKGLPARRVGSEWRFERAEVMAWSQLGSPVPEAAAAAPLEPARVASTTATAPAAGGAPPLVAANGDRVVVTLLRQLHESGTLVGLVQADRESGLRHLGAGRVLATGCHAGGFPAQVGGVRVARVHLVTREVGLAARGKVPRIRDLAKARLVSRPPSAGVRHHLDDALSAAGLDPREVHAGARLCASHLEVACAVARGEAEVGLVSRAWAEELGLAFQALAREAYGLLVRAADLGDATVVRLCEVAQSPRFSAELASVPGYDPAGAGDIKYDSV